MSIKELIKTISIEIAKEKHKTIPNDLKALEKTRRFLLEKESRRRRRSPL